ncbi:MAG: TIGR03663 family protein [Bdellovibrionota bacterium]|nr:MAG: TIGR03663 family protein [Bdellovibrionota bacterium]
MFQSLGVGRSILKRYIPELRPLSQPSGMNPDTVQPTTSTPRLSDPMTRYWIVYALFIVIGLLLRWLQLDARPYHHDESLHGMYGRYFYDFPDFHFYRYDPMLHGPFLYNLLRVVYSTVGDSNWAARSVITLLGSVFLFVPLLFRSYLSRTALLAITGYVALSPSLVYWSRFLREDFPVVAMWILMAIGALLAAPKFRALLILPAICLQISMKENAFVTFAILAGYLFFEVAFEAFRHTTGLGMFPQLRRILSLAWKTVAAIAAIVLLYEYGPSVLVAGEMPPAVIATLVGYTVLGLLLVFFLCSAALRIESYYRVRTLAASIGHNIRGHWKYALLSLAIGIFCYVYLLNAGFRYSEGALDALFRKSIGYWVEHHNMERIQGPFNFHIYVLGWYELPFMLAFFAHLYYFYRHASTGIRRTGAFLFLASVVGACLLIPETIRDQQPWKFFKLKDIYDYLGLCLLIFHPLLVTIQHLLRHERGLAFFGYFFTATFFTYSYLGEKVPWLTMYPLIAGIVYLALFFDSHFKHHPWQSFERVPLTKVVSTVGWVLVLLGGWFMVEGNPKEEDPYHWTFIAFGVSFAILALAAQALSWWGSVNLRTMLFVAVALFTVRASIQTNFVYAGHAREYISQVHTTPEFHALIMDMRREAITQHRGYAPSLFCDGTSTWPVTWYMRDIPEYKFSAKPEERPNFKYLIQDWEEPAKNVPEGFSVTRVNLRGWWLPDFNQMTLKRFLNYSINHTPWGPVGYSYAHLLVNTKRP